MYVAGGWLVVAGAAHAAGHVWTFVLEHDIYGMREFAMNAMKQAQSPDPLHPSMWRQFRAFSVGFSLLFFFTGLTDLMLVWTRAPNRLLMRFALLGTTFWTVAFGLFVFVDPVVQAIIVSGIAVPLHAIAYWTASLADGDDG